jgi:hypothetical protein
LRRLRLVLGSELSAKNKIQAFASLEIPVLRYSFGVSNWHQETLLTIHGLHHPQADVDCMYVPRKQGGRGLMQLQETYAVEITPVVEYVDSKEDQLIQIIRTYQQNINSSMSQTARCLKTGLQRGTRQIKDIKAKKTKERCQGKGIHRQFPC